jgi:hypothetical protein
MCGFLVSGQPPTVIFCVQGAIRAADRTPQQRLGVQQRPEAHCQAALAAVAAFAPSPAARACRAGRISVSVICFPLRANGERFAG